MSDNLIQFYTQKRDYYLHSKNRLAKRIRLFGWLRFFSFIAIPLFLIYLTRIGLLAGIIPAVISLIIFFILIKKYINADKQKKRFGILEEIAKNELRALNHDFSVFEGGDEFINPDHNYSYDLDLYGEGSLFQFLNRTSTLSGKKKLATWVSKPSIIKDEILKRQEAVKELASKREWRLQFLATGKLFKETTQQHQEIISWADKKLPFNNFKLTGILIWVIPILTALALILTLVTGLSHYIILFVLIQLSLTSLYGKRLKEYYQIFGQKSQLLEKYSSLLKHIDSEEYQSEWLKQNLKNINNPQSARNEITKLSTLIKEFEYGLNLLVSLILNSFLLWNVSRIYKLQKWHNKNSGSIIKWLAVIEKIDALVSLANYADNHPNYTYPKIIEKNFELNASGLGHPLLHPKKRVCSDLDIEGLSKVIIVTGANMAGKSTFLRAVGVNLILARLGVPVCAKQFKFMPIPLFTNMRTTDSLFKDESYFYAELKRISNILERLRKGEQLFVILDEMLKGTNSVDKLKGSKELVKQMIKLKTVALIATHDLKLADLENDYPKSIDNKCFEIQIKNDELTFNYTLTNGVTKSMNATFLMKKMGII